MIRAAITGGIACGKSTVLAMFAELPHVAVLSADRVVHQLYEPGEPTYNAVVKEFGRGILDGEGKIDRKRLADAAFKTEERRKRLEGIVHPAVIDFEIAWMRGLETSDGDKQLAIIEVPLLFEAKSEGKFAKTIAVTCAPEKKLARFRARHPELPEAEARKELERRAASQMPDEEKARRADLVVDNSGTVDETRERVKQVYEELVDVG